MSDIEKPYNVAYLNFSIIDELDYVIGGYGKPKQEFIFSLNSFIESYVLNETFHFSVLEWYHFTNTNKNTFKNGRPIYNILFNKGDKIIFRDWLGPFYGKCVFCEPFIEGKDESQFHIDNFQKNSSEEIKSKYFKPIIFLEPDEKFPYLWRNFGFNILPKEPNYLIIAIGRSQKEMLQGLYNENSDINCHSCMPYSGMKAQKEVNTSLLPSNQSYKILSEFHNQKIETLTKYTGYKKTPIPPLVSIVLSQCNELSDIPVKLRQLREDFTDLRNSFSELEKRIDEADNIKSQIEAIDEIRDFWNSFSKKYNKKSSRILHHFWDIKKASGVDGALEKVVDNQDAAEDFLSNLNYVSLAGKLTSKAYSFFKDKKSLNRFQGIIDLWDLSQNTPALKQQAKDYERLFKVKIDLKVLQQLYLNTV
nr:hypothetical protein [uncultured Allomuricauda sp.]